MKCHPDMCKADSCSNLRSTSEGFCEAHLELQRLRFKRPLFDEKTSRFWDVLQRVAYPGFEFGLFQHAQGYAYLQILCDGTDNVTGEPMRWKSRKWILSPHMTDGEIVQTAFKAVLTALEHEAREQFKYKGVTVFDPHYDIEKLVELRSGDGATKERT